MITFSRLYFNDDLGKLPLTSIQAWVITCQEKLCFDYLSMPQAQMYYVSKIVPQVPWKQGGDQLKMC